MTARTRALPLATILLMACAAQDAPHSAAVTGQAIVHGVVENGYAPVGALTWNVRGYRGAFCTATLIDPSWVLTAAHCLTQQDGLVVRPEIVFFLVGTDARVATSGGPTAGALYATASFHLHPDYDAVYEANDIALVKLATPVDGVPPLAYNASMLTPSGKVATYVGFGATEGVTQTGGGLKRRTDITVTAAFDTVYFSEYMGSSPCFGDSGGPALMTVDTELRVVGVNSAVGGCDPATDPSCPADPCQRGVIVTRVDPYASWIAAVMGAPPPDCRQDASVCSCGIACSAADGSCDNSACQIDDCQQVYDCLGSCGADPNCGSACYARGTDTARAALDTMLACFDAACAGASQASFSRCARDNCGAAIDACLPTGTGPLTCEAVSDCMAPCALDDQACQLACFEQGTSSAQREYNTLSQCLAVACATAADFDTCAANSCGGELDACFPPDHCSLAGGDCSAGQACALRTTGASDCVPSDGLLAGDTCANDASNLPCADGLYCLDGRCEALCVLPQHCGPDERCEKGTGATSADPGVCVAKDDLAPIEPIEPTEPDPHVVMTPPMQADAFAVDAAMPAEPQTDEPDAGAATHAPEGESQDGADMDAPSALDFGRTQSLAQASDSKPPRPSELDAGNGSDNADRATGDAGGCAVRPVTPGNAHGLCWWLWPSLFLAYRATCRRSRAGDGQTSRSSHRRRRSIERTSEP